MRKLHTVPASLFLCLWVCSCGRDRTALAEKLGANSDSNVISNGEARVTTTPIVIDARSPEEYAGGHLGGALLMRTTSSAA